MGNAIINIMLSVLIGRFQHVHICKIQLSDGTLFAVNRKFTLCLGIP